MRLLTLICSIVCAFAEPCKEKYVSILLFYDHDASWNEIVRRNGAFAEELCFSFDKLNYLVNLEEIESEIWTMQKKVSSHSDSIIFCLYLKNVSTLLNTLHIWVCPF